MENQKTNLQGKVAFITGANRAIGLETARGLAKLGATVIIGARDTEKGEAAAESLRVEGLAAEFLLNDLKRPEDDQTAYDYIANRHGKLDILVNNAGIMVEAPSASDIGENETSKLPMEQLRETFDINFFAQVRLTQALLPLIHKSASGRIVNLSSVLGSLTLHANPASPIYSLKAFAYNATKTALNAFTVHLAHELRDTTIKVNSAHPGWVQSELGGKLAPLGIEDGSLTSILLATLPDDGPTGGFFHMGEALPW
ncbi:SDR family oxidoreductase [Paenibacillus agricola]|uniref:SDR family oxidoreductase n=1 Tax=Paenibacillus agricola TaxID=2716264 RepID=A0ABX0JCH5_9BACL|nr:SDR family oxidoreductase [Paenibacillus agricola]NHN31914.1 SDR family oxidoreductase [Paenibacillus agricola]